jgi:hypothetical protein
MSGGTSVVRGETMTTIDFTGVDWTAQAYCWCCQKLVAFFMAKKRKYCDVCKTQIVHGPRATIIAPPGRTLLAFDADALHYRIAACLSQDTFINESLAKYDETHDPIWKPHVRNCAALFQVTPEQAVELMNAESMQYTFAKNFIYMLLNGGEAPALANAAAMTGLKLTIAEVDRLVKNWLAKAVGFDRWRQEGLLKQAGETGQIELFCGRRRRFYGLEMRKGVWVVNDETRKEIYNFPLIGTEVSFMNPRIDFAYEQTRGTSWKLVYHGHDGFMCEGDEGDETAFCHKLLPTLSKPTELKVGFTLKVGFAAKSGRNWALMEKEE